MITLGMELERGLVWKFNCWKNELMSGYLKAPGKKKGYLPADKEPIDIIIAQGLESLFQKV